MHVCPNCGYCPHCGRGGAVVPFRPWIKPQHPWNWTRDYWVGTPNDYKVTLAVNQARAALRG